MVIGRNLVELIEGSVASAEHGNELSMLAFGWTTGRRQRADTLCVYLLSVVRCAVNTVELRAELSCLTLWAVACGRAFLGDAPTVVQKIRTKSNFEFVSSVVHPNTRLYATCTASPLLS